MSDWQASPAEQQVLSQFADIVLPSQAGIWPLAWPVWVLIVVILASIASAVLLIWRKRKKNQYRKVALALLHELQADHESSKDNANATIAQGNEIMKACLLSAGYARKHFVALNGTDWYRYLAATLPKKSQAKYQSSQILFSNWEALSYQNTSLTGQNSVASMGDFFDFAALWVASHSPAKGQAHA